MLSLQRDEWSGDMLLLLLETVEERARCTCGVRQGEQYDYRSTVHALGCAIIAIMRA